MELEEVASMSFLWHILYHLIVYNPSVFGFFVVVVLSILCGTLCWVYVWGIHMCVCIYVCVCVFMFVCMCLFSERDWEFLCQQCRLCAQDCAGHWGRKEEIRRTSETMGVYISRGACIPCTFPRKLCIFIFCMISNMKKNAMVDCVGGINWNILWTFLIIG